MNILITTSYPSLPECIGGSQRTADTLARSMIERGHRVSLLCGLMELPRKPTLADTIIGFRKPAIRSRAIMKLLGGKAARDTLLGYPTWRARVATDAVEWVIDKVKPDVVVVMCGKLVPMALAARRAGVPVLIRLQNVSFWDLGGSFSDLGEVRYSTNSQFSADRYRQAFGVESTVIYPLIDQRQYRTATTRENITFINPVPEKGVSIALAVARECPEIPFSFVPSWPLGPWEDVDLAKLVDGIPNVRLEPRKSDMRQIYRKCGILLAPSVWEETYGRVVSEAQCSGIPVVASNRGGLPESVGAGGILVDPESPIGDWVAAVKRLWYDKTCYSRLSAAAYAHVSRPSLNKDRQLDLWEGVLSDAIELGSHAAATESAALRLVTRTQ